MGAPKVDVPPPDPVAVAAQKQAQQEEVNALQTRTQADSASLMARYGMLALASGSKGVGFQAPAPNIDLTGH